MEFERKIIDITPRPVLPDGKKYEDAVYTIAPEEVQKKAAELSRFDSLPTEEEVNRRAAEIAKLVHDAYKDEYVEMDVTMVGPNYLAAPLSEQLHNYGMGLVAPFSQRITIEKTDGDTTIKEQKFVFEKFVDIIPMTEDVVMPEEAHLGASANKILNLTQHQATKTQIERGVVEPSPASKDIIKKLITFEEAPDMETLAVNAGKLAAFAAMKGYHQALIGGASYYMPYLEAALIQNGIQPQYAFTQQVILPDGRRVFEEKGVYKPHEQLAKDVSLKRAEMARNPEMHKERSIQKNERAQDVR